MTRTHLVPREGCDGKIDDETGDLRIDENLDLAERAEVTRQLLAAQSGDWAAAPDAYHPPPCLRVIRGGRCATPGSRIVS